MGIESLAKAYVLTHGVQFTMSALEYAETVGAKRQNMVYNMPALADSNGKAVRALSNQNSSHLARPQELFFSGDDGYKVCVSATSPVHGRNSAIVDFDGKNLLLQTPDRLEIGKQLALTEFVPEPAYYNLKTRSGRAVTRWVSACGYDEMNIWPWHDCAIKQACSFCGINAVQKQVGREVDIIHSLKLRNRQNLQAYWDEIGQSVIDEITESVNLALSDPCYSQEIHLIMISGNLADHQLDTQAIIYSDIAREISKQNPTRFAEGIVAVTAPPLNTELITLMKQSGIDVGVFNLEAFTPSAFSFHCKGKNNIGRDVYLNALIKGVEVFGRGRSWCNFVFGLEPASDLLTGCEELASQGITPGANVYHRDHGASFLGEAPHLDEVLTFYSTLADIYHQHGLRPYYCEKALRTSLANEAFAGRF